jgi:hypothetical protein
MCLGSSLSHAEAVRAFVLSVVAKRGDERRKGSKELPYDLCGSWREQSAMGGRKTIPPPTCSFPLLFLLKPLKPDGRFFDAASSICRACGTREAGGRLP